MHLYKQIQEDFFNNLFISSVEQKLDFIASSNAEARFQIYKNNIFNNLSNSLKIIFPGVWAILGDKCANGIAFAFIKNHIPHSGCLDDWGDCFPEFLARIPELSELPYIKDFAIYELMKNHCYFASDLDPITSDALTDISEDMIGRVKFSFCPHVLLHQSPFPLDAIEKLVQSPQDVAHVNLDSGRIFCLIAREDKSVISYWLDEADWQFVNYMKSDYSIDEAVFAVMQFDVNFDITNIIAFLLRHKLIARINLPKDK